MANTTLKIPVDDLLMEMQRSPSLKERNTALAIKKLADGLSVNTVTGPVGPPGPAGPPGESTVGDGAIAGYW